MGGMDEFNKLRARAKAKWDKLIAQVRAEYDATLVQIATLAKRLIGDPARDKSLASMVEQAIPADAPFTITDVKETLDALHPGRLWRRATVNNHVTRLRDRGIIKRIRRGTMTTGAVFARADLPLEVEDKPTLAKVVAAVVTRPMRVAEIAVAVREAGY
jgi:hypothetical protein